MDHKIMAKVLAQMCPDAEWSLSGDKLIWLDKKQVQPTLDAISKAVAAYVEPPTLQEQVKTLQAQVATLVAAQNKGA